MIGWIDAASGASGDMLLGALLDAGVDETIIASAIAAVAPEATSITPERVRRGALSACRATVGVADSTTHRGLRDVVSLIKAANLDTHVTRHVIAVFTRLAEAEAQVHGVATDEVHFHEVGALDAIADIVGVCAGFESLHLDELHCNPIAVGSGEVRTAHGLLGVPAPAVVLLLRGVPTYAGPAVSELCTPTGAALLSHWVSTWGPQPLMAVSSVGLGAGSRDFDSHANVVRLLIGEATGVCAPVPEAPARIVLYETNVDDLDPRLWPLVLQRLLVAGAADAWLTPILMKKGRPAHTLSVLVRDDLGPSVRRVIFAETSAIGLRELRVAKHALDRRFVKVEVGGQLVSVKLALSEGVVVNVQPEYDDVVAAADVLGRPVKMVLAEAIAQAVRQAPYAPDMRR
ncbi:MAG: nickel pincer cofactor biosynthesis protein LarC [Nocardioidaceae bacterium]